MKHTASFSGGKDSTAMVLMLIEKQWPLDEIVFFDTGWEFPQMLEHIDRFEQYIQRPITRLHPVEPFDYVMTKKPIVRRCKSDPMHGKIYKCGHGWPSLWMRWCTKHKIRTIDKHCGFAVQYVGIASDETKRIEKQKSKPRHQCSYPLADWGMTEADCLKLCYDHGFDFGGLYRHFNRVSCFCCPINSLKNKRLLKAHYPELWKRMLEMGDRIADGKGKRFQTYDSIRELDERFNAELKQGMLPL